MVWFKAFEVHFINMTFLILFISVFTFLTVFALFFFIYYICFKEEDEESEQFHNRCIPDVLQFKESNYNKPELLKKLPKLELIRLELSKKCFEINKPILNYITLSSNEIDTASLLIRDRGIQSFYFMDYNDQISELIDLVANGLDDNDDENETENRNIENNATNTNLIANESTSLINNKKSNKNKYLTFEESDFDDLRFKSPPYVVEDLTDISFLTSKMSSAVLNLPIPVRNRKNDTIYFETKLFEFNPSTTLLSIGLVTKPYPNFELPGLSPYSIGLQTDGTLRMSNKPFINDDDLPVVLPQLIEGDVIGIGYKSISGAIFITHNGKQVLEVIRHFKAELFPSIGSVGDKCKVTVNLGQLGFVYIEANVKKLGFCENHNEGSIGAPPIYESNSITKDKLLDKGEELPPSYPAEEETFFGPKSIIEKPTMLSTIKENSNSSSNGNNNNNKNHNEDNNKSNIDDNNNVLLVGSSCSQEKAKKKDDGGHGDSIKKGKRESTTLAKSERSNTPASEPPSYHSEKSNETEELKSTQEEAQLVLKQQEEEPENSTDDSSKNFDLPNVEEYERIINNIQPDEARLSPILTPSNFDTLKHLHGKLDAKNKSKPTVQENSINAQSEETIINGPITLTESESVTPEPSSATNAEGNPSNSKTKKANMNKKKKKKSKNRKKGKK